MSMAHLYHEGYFERAEGSNYTEYQDDPGWPITVAVMSVVLPPPAKIAEVGCAKGYFIIHALEHGYDAEGLDISAYAVGAAPTGVQPRLHVGDIVEGSPWEPQSLDAVISWELLEHIPEEDVEQTMVNLLRPLKPGGLFLHRIALLEANMDDDHDVTHVTMKTREWWEDLFTGFGLVREPRLQAFLKGSFMERDWRDRFFSWRLPSG